VADNETNQKILTLPDFVDKASGERQRRGIYIVPARKSWQASSAARSERGDAAPLGLTHKIRRDQDKLGNDMALQDRAEIKGRNTATEAKHAVPYQPK
jgi:hypothetical protein